MASGLDSSIYSCVQACIYVSGPMFCPHWLLWQGGGRHFWLVFLYMIYIVTIADAVVESDGFLCLSLSWVWNGLAGFLLNMRRSRNSQSRKWLIILHTTVAWLQLPHSYNGLPAGRHDRFSLSSFSQTTGATRLLQGYRPVVSTRLTGLISHCLPNR